MVEMWWLVSCACTCKCLSTSKRVAVLLEAGLSWKQEKIEKKKKNIFQTKKK